MNTFLKEWYSLYESKSGERGIFNRESAQNKVASIGRRDSDHEFGTNPCSEIILRPYQFCNLTEVVVRAEDTVTSLTKKIEWATQLGTYQSCLTDFKYLRKIWKQNTEEERLLGVSLTGILDNEMLSTNNCMLTDMLVGFRQIAVKTNEKLAKKIGINQSTAITCVKPSGTVSQLVDSASGIHPRHSEYYIRTVRGDNKDPLTQFMIQSGIPAEPAIGNEDNMTVFSFPVQSPKGALTRDSLTAVEHLELWKTYAENWCEHKPSITISVKEHEWLEVGDWVYKNFDHISGVSFLPHSDHTYQQAPYTDCRKEEYESLVKKMPDTINWEGLKEIEVEDTTTGSQELSCTGEVCEVVDIGV